MNRLAQAFVAGCGIGALGGLIGLGGAEFRLPLLIGLFGFAALHAVILNKATSLVVVAAALVFRTKAVPFDAVIANAAIVLNLLAGSLLGAWLGAGWATRMKHQLLYRVIAVLLILIAGVLLAEHWLPGHGEPLLTGWAQQVAGVVVGFAIGVVASLMGVAGGELLIPTLVLLFGADIKLAGSLSLAVSLPTMIVGFLRYSQDSSFAVLKQNKSFMLTMAAGSLVGVAIGRGVAGRRAIERAAADAGCHPRDLVGEGLAARVAAGINGLCRSTAAAERVGTGQCHRNRRRSSRRPSASTRSYTVRTRKRIGMHRWACAPA